MTAVTPILADIAFPLGIRLTHAFNIVFLTLLVRSGIEILGGHPMLYFNEDCRPGSEWIRFSSKRMHRDRRWTAEDEKQDYNSLLALPGHDHLGLGRFWHFVAAIGWLATGVLYLLILFTTDQWTRVVPTDWAVFVDAWRTGLEYLALDVPASGTTYNALQQLTYFLIVFIVSPVQILTGLAMAPAIEGRFPWYSKVFGGRQAARSIHFIAMIVFIAFTVHHVALVIAHGLLDGLAAMVLGVAAPDGADHALAAAVTLAFLAGLVWLHSWATRRSLQRPRDTQRMLQHLLDPVEQHVLMPLQSRQDWDRGDISVDPRPNGRPPRNPAFVALADNDFAEFRLEVSGLVEAPMSLSLDDLAALPADEHVVQHKCIQGWSYVAAWEGVALSALLDRVKPLPNARFLVVRTFDDKWEVTDDQQGGDDVFYAAVDLDLARHPQSMLAWGMNDRALPIAYGGPLRLRLESQLGYNMAKWVRSIELVASIDDIGDGSGGWRPDKLYYSHLAPI